MDTSLSFAEFFAGIGLVRKGLESEGWQVSFANDNDPQKFEMYEGHFGSASAYYSRESIVDLKGTDVPEVTLATASFPCNDLSLAGSRAGIKGKNSSMFWEFIRILKEMGYRKPPIVLLENVHGFLTSRKGKDFQIALQALNELGYVVDPLIINADRFVPQSRVRLFVVAHLQPNCQTRAMSVMDQQFEFFEDHVRPRELARAIQALPQIEWKLRPLPLLPTNTTRLCDVVERIPSESSLWWSEDRASYLLNQMSVSHRSVADSMIRGKTQSWGTVFRRMRKGRSMAELRTDGIAGCLRTPKGGSARQILFEAGYGQYRVRFLSPREAARLMGADDFQIVTTVTKALYGFGDAVCVPVISWIARNYLSPLAAELKSVHDYERIAV